ncbi:hypothetical protein BDR06DRAFT_952938 [Suillus hirtellus]|nr:hypothetical protein BDR06DRAFT_952938 [Suillus hirtellus]
MKIRKLKTAPAGPLPTSLHDGASPTLLTEHVNARICQTDQVACDQPDLYHHGQVEWLLRQTLNKISDVVKAGHESTMILRYILCTLFALVYPEILSVIVSHNWEVHSRNFLDS